MKYLLEERSSTYWILHPGTIISTPSLFMRARAVGLVVATDSGENGTLGAVFVDCQGAMISGQSMVSEGTKNSITFMRAFIVNSKRQIMSNDLCSLSYSEMLDQFPATLMHH